MNQKTSNLVAWLDCPYGKTNDPYPGSCQLYLDTNNNQICDHSEAPPAQPQPLPSPPPSWFSPLFFTTFLTLLFWFSHWYLTYQTSLRKKTSFFSPAGFKYFWNLILLILFLPAGFSGVILIKIQNPTFSSLHQLTGVAFLLLGLIHSFSRLNYFLKGKKILFSKNS